MRDDDDDDGNDKQGQSVNSSRLAPGDAQFATIYIHLSNMYLVQSMYLHVCAPATEY